MRDGRDRFGFATSAILIVVTLLATRWWSAAHCLLNADAIQYVRALTIFDLANRVPHAPGYIIFVMAGRLAHLFIKDANAAYFVVNLAAQAVTLLLTLSLIRHYVDSLSAFLAVLVVLLHPLFWYYGSVTAVYTSDAAAMILVGWMAYQYAHRPIASQAFLTGFVWGAVGGIRQFVTVFTTPAIVWCLWRERKWSAVAWFGIGAGCGLAIWFVPLMILSGGWEAYHKISTGVFSYYLHRQSPLFSSDLRGIFGDLMLWLDAVLQLLLPMVFLAAGAWLTRREGPGREGKRSSWPNGAFWLVLVVPALLFYALFHIGQVGYVLGLLSPIMLFYIATLAGRFTQPRGRWILRGSLLASALVGGLWFAAAQPPTARLPYDLPPDYYLNPSHWKTIAAKIYKYHADYTREGIRKWDAITQGYLGWLHEQSPDSTLVVYNYDREFFYSILRYGAPEFTMVSRDEFEGYWAYQAPPAGDGTIVTGDSLTRLIPSPTITTVAIIDDHPERYPGLRPVIPDLDRWGKAPIVLHRPDTVRIDNLVVSW